MPGQNHASAGSKSKSQILTCSRQTFKVKGKGKGKLLRQRQSFEIKGKIKGKDVRYLLLNLLFISSAATATATSEVFERLGSHMSPWWETIIIFGYLLGFCLLVSGLVKAGSSGRQGGTSAGIKAGIYGLVSGTLLLNLIPFIGVLGTSILATDANTTLSGLSYTPPTSASNVVSSAYIRFAVYLIMIVGLIGVIKGISIFNSSQEAGKPLGEAFTHVIGGTIAINIIEFAKIVGFTMGGAGQTFVQDLLG